MEVPPMSELGRVVAANDIRQLAYRYALALDSREFAAFGELFTADAELHAVLSGVLNGRENIVRAISDTFSTWGATVHFVGNHVIDVGDAGSATGVVYTRAEHEVGDRWIVQAMQYWDDYAHADGVWRFARRRMFAWYAVDQLDRPTGPETMRWPHGPAAARTLPEGMPRYDFTARP